MAKPFGWCGKVVVGVLVPLVLQAGCTGGQSPFSPGSALDQEFAAAAVTWDLNHDGDVTCEEWKGYAAGLFRGADANRDGFLIKDEFVILARQDRLFDTAGFGHFDANADGRIALAEITDRPNPAFALSDANKDCVLSPDERRRRPDGAKPQTDPPPAGRPGPRRQ
ncbi:MAG: histidine kinase [Hyphomicrobiaceae bacterium]|nr:MAG: histidine kinase [Hyphomicrobiaceae bacterium]